MLVHNNHPFANGKIVTILDNNSVRVIAGGRSLIIDSVAIDSHEVIPGDVLDIKYSLISPQVELNYALSHVPTTLSMNKSEKKYKKEAANH